jgi:molybdopterin-binding protein
VDIGVGDGCRYSHLRVNWPLVNAIAHFKVSEAAALLGVSDDTVRRWAEAGRLTLSGTPATIDGVELAALSQQLGVEAGASTTSARNRFTGIVTKVTSDTVMAQVELQAGPFRVVSLISREAVDELGLQPGVLAVATIKATNVGIELP